MEPSFYDFDPSVRAYFETLPPIVQGLIIESGIKICTLGELQMVAERFKEQYE
ncbi:hypothetical protein [Feifania hominis]|uniref:Uncharacterized protein n=1 Tax=Feifania hominis TaxID=2763660 RepID=A0A926DGX5_9FIRM|nr:hypothetical protein [Feifania hominis]MBC8536850.1 hypothetical protein [Feifania hominis]